MPISIIPFEKETQTAVNPISLEAQSEAPPPKPLAFQSPLAQISELRYSATNSKLGQFGPVRHRADGSVRNHKGIDMRAASGTPVYASESGRAQIKQDPKGYGLYVVIEHKNGYQTLYGHLDGVGVKNGEKIEKGTVIGEVGTSGNASQDDPHLHFEVRKDGVPVDPMPFLPAQSTEPSRLGGLNV